MAVLIPNLWVAFIMFLRGEEKCSEGNGDQSIIEDIPIRSSPKLYC